MWRPTQTQIEEWLGKKMEFSTRENENPKYDAQRWLHKYIHSNLHEIFFCIVSYYFGRVVIKAV